MSSPAELPEIPAADVPHEAVVLDVREDDEWAAGHIDGAVHIPLGDLPARTGELPDAAPLYVVCRGGGRSGRATAYLNNLGVEATNVAGGMGAWAAAERPMVSEGDTPPYVL